jgi:protein-L-isoaspartate(D-aspartate) O-methyltransferase
MLDFEALRQRMVDHQLRPSEITDYDVIRAFMTVPRERFVEPAEQLFAYGDGELTMSASAPHRRMMAPVQLGRLVQALPHGPDAKAMVIGCGTGYSAAILARLVHSVVAVEEDETLAVLARQRLKAVGADNVRIVEGRLVDGHPAEAPYESILIDGAVEIVPAALIRQLVPEGLLATIVRGEAISRGMLYERIGDEAAEWPLFEAWATLLPGFERAREFVF